MTPSQIIAIILVLKAFGVSPDLIATIQAEITPVQNTIPSDPSSPVTDPTVPVAPTQPVSTPTEPVFGGTSTNTVQSSKPMDTTPFYVTQLSIDTIDARSAPPIDNGAPAGTYLRITSNKTIDLSTVVLPDGVTIGTPTYNGPPLSGQAQTLIRAGGKTWVGYYYEVALTGAQQAENPGGTLTITVSDSDGNKITRDVQVN